MESANSTPHQAPARERQSVQRLLRGGLGLGGALMAAGFLTALFQDGLDLRPFALKSLFTSGVPAGDRLMGLGVLVLASTPAIRVLALLVLWAQEKDRKFVFVALAVIATLALAVALGGG